jgi:F0F1-type ATP synthase assembly protein I
MKSAMTETEKQNKKSFYVAASPFNPVKLELVIIILIGIVLWMTLDSITNKSFTQIVTLLLFGCVGAGWLLTRIRLIVLRNRTDNK